MPIANVPKPVSWALWCGLVAKAAGPRYSHPAGFSHQTISLALSLRRGCHKPSAWGQHPRALFGVLWGLHEAA